MFMIMKLKNEYPKEIQLICNKAIEIVIQEGEQDYNNEEKQKLAFDHLCKSLMPKYIKGELLVWTEEEFMDNWKEIEAHYALNKMIKKGLVNYIEDENGEEIYFLTEEGKRLAIKEKLNGNNLPFSGALS